MLPLIRIWILGILCLSVTVVFVGYHIVVHKEMLLEKTRSEMDRQVSWLAMDIERTLFGLQQLLAGLEIYLEASFKDSTGDPAKVRRTLQRLMQENPYIANLLVLTPDGEVAYWNQPGPAPKLLQSDFFQIHSQETLRELFVGAPGPSLMQADRWMFGVSRAARDEDGALVRVLAAIIDLEYLHQLNRSLSAPPASILTISSAQGVVYSRIPEPDLFVGRRLSGIAERASLVASTLALRHKSSLDGKDYLVAAHKVGSFPLVAMVARPEEAVLKPWRHDRLIFVVWGLFSGLLILLMTLRTATYQRNQTRTRKTLHQQAITDPLTAIFNRRYAVEQAQLEIRKGQRTGGNLSFVLLDLDHFKSVNDGYGHDAGDRVLIAIARILKEICRSTDIVSRFGGEEFLLVLPGTDLEGAMVIAEKIRLALEKQNHHYSGKTFQVTASFGVSQWMVDEADIREVLLRTDDALYQVKSNGRNQIRSAPARSTPGRAPGMVSWRYDGL